MTPVCTLVLEHTRACSSNAITIGSTVFARLVCQTSRHTGRPRHVTTSVAIAALHDILATWHNSFHAVTRCTAPRRGRAVRSVAGPSGARRSKSWWSSWPTSRSSRRHRVQTSRRTDAADRRRCLTRTASTAACRRNTTFIDVICSNTPHSIHTHMISIINRCYALHLSSPVYIG